MNERQKVSRTSKTRFPPPPPPSLSSRSGSATVTSKRKELRLKIIACMPYLIAYFHCYSLSLLIAFIVNLALGVQG